MMEFGDFRVDGNGSALFGTVDELTNFLEQVIERSEVVHGAS